MKSRVILLAIIILAATLLLPISATLCDTNTEVYHYVNSDTTMLINDTLLSGETMKIPRTYYVKFISDDPTNVGNKIVEYNSMRGSIASSTLSKRTTSAISGSLYYTHTNIINAIDKKPPVALYSNTSYKFLGQINTTVPLKFIALANNDFYLVEATLIDSTIVKGYIMAIEISSTTAIPTIIPINTGAVNPDLSLDNDILKPPANSQPESPSNNIVKIILISLVCVLSVVVVFLIFKPTKTKKSKNEYYDNNDSQK